MARFGKQRGKRLGGEAPRRRTRWARNRGLPESTPPVSALVVLAIGLFVVGTMAGYAWALDREIRGGILRQRAEAAQRPDWVDLRALQRTPGDPLAGDVLGDLGVPFDGHPERALRLPVRAGVAPRASR